MTHGQPETNAADIRLPELAVDLKELQAEEAEQVNGGIIAVLIGLNKPPTASFTGGVYTPQP